MDALVHIEPFYLSCPKRALRESPFEIGHLEAANDLREPYQGTSAATGTTTPSLAHLPTDPLFPQSFRRDSDNDAIIMKFLTVLLLVSTLATSTNGFLLIPTPGNSFVLNAEVDNEVDFDGTSLQCGWYRPGY